MMGGKRILSDAQLDVMAAKREAGLTDAQIARYFTARGTPVSSGAISWQCLRLGIDLPPSRRKPSTQQTRPMRRGDHFVRPFTPSEDAALLSLEAAGLPYSQIGLRLSPPRKSNSVKGRLLVLARRQARLEATANG